MNLRTAFLSVAALGLATSLFAQTRANVEINPFGGYLFGGQFSRGSTTLFTSAVDVDDHATYGGRIGFLVTRWFELEGQYSRTETFFVSRQGSNGLFGPDLQRLGDLDIDYYLGYMTFNFGHNRRVIPYVTIGAGAARLDPNVPGANPESETKFTGSLGAGLKTMFNRNFGLRFDARYYATRIRNDDSQDRCRSFADDCGNRSGRDWLTNGDVNGGFVIAF